MAEARLEVITRTPEESKERLKVLEGVIRRGKEAYLKVGRALDEIRKEELYKPEYKNFDSYCRETFGWTRRYADRHITWARVAAYLAPIGVNPANEAQAREIGRLAELPEVARRVWDEVGEANSGAHPSTALKKAVDAALGSLVDPPSNLKPGEGDEVLERYGKLKEELPEDLTPKRMNAAGKSARRAKRTREAEDARKNRQPITETGEGDVHIYHRELRYPDDLHDLVSDGEVDLVLTDPPYHTDDMTMSLWDALGKFARRVLKPDGLLVSYMGNYRIPDAIGRVEQNVPWWWQMIVTYSAKDPAHGKGFFLDYKPIQVFSSATGEPGDRLKGNRQSVLDSKGKEKSQHPWQQPLAEAIHLIKSFTRPGDLVCDPFSGSGTVAVAAKMTGRRCIAVEKDAAWHADSVDRLLKTPAPAPATPGQPATVSAIFGPSDPPARSAGTEEARIEGVRDALEGVSAEVIVLRPRDISESSRKLRRRRFSR